MSGAVSTFNSTSVGSLWNATSVSIAKLTEKTSFIDFFVRVQALGDLAVLKSNVYVCDHFYLNSLQKEVCGPYTFAELSTVSAYDAWKDNATVLPVGEFVRLTQTLQHLDSYDFCSPISPIQIAVLLKFISGCCETADLVTDHVFLRDTAGVIYRAAVDGEGKVGDYRVFYVPHFVWGMSDFEGANKLVNLNDKHPVVAAILAGRITEARKLKHVVIPHFLVSLDGSVQEIKRFDEDAAGAGLFNSRIFMESLDISYIVDLRYFKGDTGAVWNSETGTTLQCCCSGNNFFFPKAVRLTSVIMGPQTDIAGVQYAFADSILTDIKVANNGMPLLADSLTVITQEIYTAATALYTSTEADNSVYVHGPILHTYVMPTGGNVNEENENIGPQSPENKLEMDKLVATSGANFNFPASTKTGTYAPTPVYMVYAKTLIPVPN